MRTIFATCALLIALTPGAHADSFTFDKAHTDIRASWDHLGLSRQQVRFTDVSGSVTFDPATPEAATVAVTIRVAGLMTGVPALDTLLKSTKDYFDATTYPEITFKSRGVHATGEKTAELDGELTINGVTQPVKLAVVMNFVGPHPLGAINPTFQGKVAAGFSARTQILRSAFGLSRLIPLVSDELRISIEAELQKTP